MKQVVLLWWLGLLSLALPQASAETIQYGLRVPAGFEVTEYAGSDLANDIYCMTLDPQGRLVVSGQGYLRVLVDERNAGKASRAIEIAAGPRDGAMGLLWEREWLYYTGDEGLRRYRIDQKTSLGKGPSELIRAMKTGGEHDAHAICRGPDGWLYVLCGNMTGIDRSYAQLSTSPVKKPIAGCVLRFTPDLRYSEIVADGFRNAYGMDFNLDGELFTFDSDNERCISLPWYEPIRFYHVIPGGHYGWLAPQKGQWWRFPPYFEDVVAPVATFGRGSPTGVACYRHTAFPKHYHGGVFLLDWTFGRVYFVSPERSGSTYTCKKEIFLESVGEEGFAPTAVVVHPVSGDLYISIGGRGTRGAVYRVHYGRPNKPTQSSGNGSLRIKPRSLEWRRDLTRSLLTRAIKGNGLDRRNALAGMLRHRVRFQTRQVLEVVRTNWDQADRYLRNTAAALCATLPEKARRKLVRNAAGPSEQLTLAYAGLPGDPAAALDRATAILVARGTSLQARQSAVRLMQVALGDVTAAGLKGTVWEGYAPGISDFWATAQDPLPPKGSRHPRRLEKALFTRVLSALRKAFPSHDANLDRELARMLAVLEDDHPDTLAKFSRMVTVDSDPVEDIHYLIVLARLKGPRSGALTAHTAAALLALDSKLAKLHWNRDAHWPLRVAEIHAALARKDPRLNPGLLDHRDFGRPDHVLFVQAPGFNRTRAAAVFLAHARKNKNYEWNPALVELVGMLPGSQARPLLRQLWDRGGLEEAILAVLAQQPETADREKYVEGLQSPQLATVRRCLAALEKLPVKKDGATTLALVQALRRLPDGKVERAVAVQLAKYLHKLTGRSKFGTNKDGWATWFVRTYPNLGSRLGNEEGVDVAGWAKRLSGLDWSQGHSERGRKVFFKANCASCHSRAQALGPDLTGVGGRFSRNDLFTAILQPSKDVSPRYRTTQITTADGKVYQGMIVYEAVGSVLLQTGPGKTIRLINKQIVEKRKTTQSLMPAGLIDKLSDREIADLYAYLKSLSSAPPKNGKKGT
jgi:putative heme-binding domain-containing protein